jgi:hypothetical protein
MQKSHLPKFPAMTMKSFSAQDQLVTTMINKRFDLEQDIMQCWNLVDDLSLLDAYVSDSYEATKLLEGLKTIYQKKFEKCMSTFESYINTRD